MLRVAFVVGVVLAGIWVVLAVFVLVARPDSGTLRTAIGVLPDTLRLLRRIATDRTIPRRTRWLLWLAVAYLASPIDLVPDFIPLIGWADDAVVAVFVLRRVLRSAGTAKLREHWAGDDEGLELVRRIVGLSAGP